MSEGDETVIDPETVEEISEEIDPARADHIEIWENATGQWRWEMVAPNGEPLYNGEAYDSKSNLNRFLTSRFPDVETRELTLGQRMVNSRGRSRPRP